MTTKSTMKADLRSSTYAGITDYLTSVGDSVEPSVNGILVWDNDRQLWFEVSVRVKDDNFNVLEARKRYAEKTAKAAERAEKVKASAELAMEKAKNRAERAAKNIK